MRENLTLPCTYPEMQSEGRGELLGSCIDPPATLWPKTLVPQKTTAGQSEQWREIAGHKLLMNFVQVLATYNTSHIAVRTVSTSAALYVPANLSQNSGTSTKLLRRVFYFEDGELDVISSFQDSMLHNHQFRKPDQHPRILHMPMAILTCSIPIEK